MDARICLKFGSAFIVCAIAALTPAQASATSAQIIDQGGAGGGSAYAGEAARAEDLSTLFFNPAGLAALEESAPDLESSSALFVMPSVSIAGRMLRSNRLRRQERPCSAAFSARVRPQG